MAARLREQNEARDEQRGRGNYKGYKDALFVLITRDLQ